MIYFIFLITYLKFGRVVKVLNPTIVTVEEDNPKQIIKHKIKMSKFGRVVKGAWLRSK